MKQNADFHEGISAWSTATYISTYPKIFKTTNDSFQMR